MTTTNNPLRIAIIEDERPMADLIADILQPLKPEVQIFETGKAFLKSVATERFSHVVLDLSLPDIDGMELIPHLPQTHADCAIVLISGHSMDVIQAAAYYAKALGLASISTLQKPFSATDLRSALGFAPRESTPVLG
jgi:FixJ family two-component response regulator